MGYEFVGCEHAQEGRQRVLRIYIDKPSGVTVTDCSLVSRQAGAMLDVEDLIPSKYTLEVSSPGINRPLFELAHYQKYIGSRVKIRLHFPVNQRRQFSGVLVGVDGEDISLLVDNDETNTVLSFANIERAHVVAEIHL
ncbi:MAG: hypothetical protein A3E83_00055 [Gammaproteobacteria bacterium RIFCSPHIGHO2_12_FULL_41_20]|nr:MAG: hypothetical protein A3E83_00055 [Gammaproteobacteria bacterium RIFCSPHIGHO2_12_FULL_41_20]